MDHREVGEIWNANAPHWTKLARLGYDRYRDLVNTPAFLELLPEVAGLTGLDIGCGEGHNTRLLARRGARMTAIDISSAFVAEARQAESDEPLGIAYREASAVALPFERGCFDFATGFMSFMDIPETEKVIAEACRVLRPGGFLQFSILHPCFFTPRWQWVLDETGRRVAVQCGDYFREGDGEIEEWTFGSAPAELRAVTPPFRVPRFNRPLSTWLNLLCQAGLVLEACVEPRADAAALARAPHLYDTHVIAYFLILRCRKPAGTSG